MSKRLHAKYSRPYLLRGLTIDRPNQVWGVDITYLRMGKGFMYLFNIIDWYSRKVIDYELSSTLEKGFVLKCLRRAFSRCKPEIMNSDCIYLNEFEDPRALRKGIARYVQFYNQERPHQSLNDAKPDQFYAHPIRSQ